MPNASTNVSERRQIYNTNIVFAIPEFQKIIVAKNGIHFASENFFQKIDPTPIDRVSGFRIQYVYLKAIPEQTLLKGTKVAIVKSVRRTQALLRLGLAGASKSGKSRTSLTIAKGLLAFLEERRDQYGEPFFGNGRILVIDAENQSSRKYAKIDENDNRPDAFDFDAIFLYRPYSPEKYIAALKEAEKEKYTILIVDQISHEWSGSGGVLESVTEEAEATSSKNTFAAWKNAGNRHNAFIETFLEYPGHVICTMRSKVKHRYDKENKQVVKLGVKPIQRQEIIYEYDMMGTMTHDHNLHFEGSRCPYVDNARFIKPTEDLGRGIGEWLILGETATESHRAKLDSTRVRRLYALWREIGFDEDAILENLTARGVGSADDLLEHVADDMIQKMESYIDQEKKRQKVEEAKAKRKSKKDPEPVNEETATEASPPSPGSLESGEAAPHFQPLTTVQMGEQIDQMMSGE